MKKAMALFLALTLAVSLLAGCGGPGGSGSSGNSDVPSYASLKVGEDYTDITAELRVITHRTDIIDTTFAQYVAEFNKGDYAMQRIAQAAHRMLTDRLLPFWRNLLDEEHGGYYGYMDFDLHLDKTAEKGCILNSRILWFFSQAAMTVGDSALIPYARHAYRFLADSCLDREQGGVYWSVTYDGQPLDTTKHTYNQAFAIYALSAYYRLTGEAEALTLAEDLFDIIETRCTDAGGYLEAFTRDFRPASNEKLSENGVMKEGP